MEGRDAFGLDRSKPLTGMELLLGHECRANGNGTNHQALWVAHRARIQERQVAVVASRRRFRAPAPLPARDRILEPEDPDVVPQPSPSPPDQALRIGEPGDEGSNSALAATSDRWYVVKLTKTEG